MRTFQDTILASACLLGVNCRYDGKSSRNERLIRLLKRKKVLPVCPEQLGGLPTPRDAAVFVGGAGAEVLRGNAQVRTKSGKDVTAHFVRGANEVARIAGLAGARVWIGKEGSPSCGVRRVVANGKVYRGSGVTTSLLFERGLTVTTNFSRSAGVRRSRGERKRKKVTHG